MAFSGQVKWFNNKTGYGFITPEDKNMTDIFVHHTGVKTSTSQFRYLVDGECVKFNIQHCENDRVIATDVTGCDGMKLMCEKQCGIKQTRINIEDKKNVIKLYKKQINTGSSMYIADDGSIWKMVKKESFNKHFS